MVDAARGGISRRRVIQMAAVGASSVALGGLRLPDAVAGPTDRRFDTIDGTPLYFWRWNDGTAGQRLERRAFSSSAAFHERLVVWIRDVRDLANRYGGFRGMHRIVTAGIYVDKPGQHGLGQAIDIDQIAWANGAITPYHREHGADDLRVRRRYLALDAVCRRHFRYVLDGRYNSDHEDHIHMDFGGGRVGLDKASRSETVFVQHALNAHMDARLALTGRWNGATDAAFYESCRLLGVNQNPIFSVGHWRHWLFRAASCGFANVPFVAAPLDQIDRLQEIIEHVGRETLKGIGRVVGR